MTATGRGGRVERRARQLLPPGEAADWISIDDDPGEAQEAPRFAQTDTPGPAYNDPAEALVRFYDPPEHGTAWQLPVTRLICRKLAKKYGKNREEAGSKLKATLLDFEKKAGSTFIRSTDGRPWIWADDKQKILPINLKNKRFAEWVTTKYGLVGTEGVSKTAIADLAAWTMEHGELREIRRFSFYDKTAGVLYLSNYDDTVYKITGHGIEVIPNGDGVLFINDEGGVPVNARIPVYTNGHRPMGLFNALVNDLNFAPESTSGMNDVAQKTLFTIWIMALAFPDIMPSKPLLLMLGGPGSGKCLGRGTPVLMFDGTIKPVEQVANGDLVMGPDSTSRTVTGVTRGRGPLFRVVPVKGEPWICNEDHILTVKRQHAIPGGKRGIFTYKDAIMDVSVRELRKADYKLTQHGRPYLFRTGVTYPAQPTAVDPYLLGLWLGDGTKTSPAITNCEPEIIDFCRSVAPAYGCKFNLTWHPDKNTYTLRFTDPRATRSRPNGLMKGLREATSTGIKRIPHNYLINDRTARLRLLAGLLDTDGSMEHGGFEITFKDRELADDVLHLARGLGFAAYVSEKRATIKSIGFEGIYWRVYISGHTNKIPCLVPRRQAPSRRQIKDVNRTSFTIEPIGEGDFYGFALDGDHRFLLGDHTVTHNSSSVERVQLMIQGRSMAKSLGQNDEKDFGVTIMKEAVALLDNVDTPIEWLKDALAAYCTGGSWTRRKLHTDDDLITFKPHAFIAIATKNPATFRRDDMADRSIVVELTRRFGTETGAVGGVPLEQLRERILSNRPTLYGEWLWYLNKIVHALNNPIPADDTPTQHRMADFAKFAFIAGRALGYYTVAEVEAALQAEVGARVQMASDGDALLDILDRWMDQVNNIARLITGLALFTELAGLAENLHMPFLKSPRSLIDRLRRPDEALAARFVITAVEMNGGRGAGRSVAYEIRRKVAVIS